MKKILSVILAVALVFSIAGCTNTQTKTKTEDDAYQYLTDFFASYTKMSEYLNSSQISVSDFELDGQDISSILKAVYQAKSVSYIFSKPTKVGENIFVTKVEVTAPDAKALVEMYEIDRMFIEGELPEDFVAQCFYDNICTGTAKDITTEVDITIRYNGGGWSIDPTDNLAFAIFPNINQVTSNN